MAGKNTFNFLLWLITFFEAIFGSAILQTPTDRVESANKSEHTRACHSSTEPFSLFEAEPASDGSTEQDAFLTCFYSYYLTMSFQEHNLYSRAD